MIDVLINFFNDNWEIISWVVLGLAIPGLLYLNYKVAHYSDQKLLRKYGSYDKIPEDRKYPPIGW